MLGTLLGRNNMKVVSVALWSSVIFLSFFALFPSWIRNSHATEVQQIPGFSIAIQVPQQVKIGAQIDTMIILTNTSTHDIGLMQGFFGYVVEVRDAAGKLLQETEKGKELNRRQGMNPSRITKMKKLSPGEKWETAFPVNEWFDMSHSGKYSIMLTREKVASNIATVTVVE
jgi:hypothetical protein